MGNWEEMVEQPDETFDVRHYSLLSPPPPGKKRTHLQKVNRFLESLPGPAELSGERIPQILFFWCQRNNFFCVKKNTTI